MHHPLSDLARAWRDVTTDRRTLAKAGAVMASLALFDFTTGDAQNDAATDGLTQAVDWYESDDSDAVSAADADGFITIDADFSFTAVGASWSGDVGIWPLVEIQVSYDGSTFSDIVVLPADADQGLPARDGRIFTRLLFTNGESVIRYRTTDQNGVPVPVEGFGLTYIDASAGPTLSDLQNVEPANITTPPSIVSRAGWGADESLRISGGNEVFPREYVIVQHAVVHHSETPNESDPLQQMRSIYYFHAITRGWGDIGYNYLVDKYGNVYEGRVGGENVVGAHALGHNYGSAGTCMIGDFLTTSPPAAGVSALVGILSWVCRGLDPLGSSFFIDVANLPTICGHRDVVDTTCPGDYLYAVLPSIRQSVATTINNSPPSPPGGFVVGELASVATGDGVPVNLRQSAGTSSSVVTQLSEGVLGQITGNPSQVAGINWYPISTFLGAGWVDPSYLQLQYSTLVSSALFISGDVVTANRATAVLLERPDPAALVSGTVTTGTQMTVKAGPRFLGEKVWYRLTNDTTGGWADQGDFLLSAHGSAGTPALGNAVSVTTAANLRDQPTTSGQLLTQLPLGTEGTVLAGPVAANGYSWFQLRTAFGQGWVVSTYLHVAGNGGTTPVPSPSPSPTATSVPGALKIGDTVFNPEAVNLRAQPGTAAAILAVMSPNTSGTVLAGPTAANGYTWYRLQTSYGAGWAAGEFLQKSASAPTPTPSATSIPSGNFPAGSSVKTTTSVNLRASASTSSAVLAVLPSASTATVQSGPTNAGGRAWYQVQSAMGTGWVAASYLVLTATPGGIQIGSTVKTTSGLRLRSTPSSSGAVLTTMPTGTQGKVVGGPTTANGYTWWQLQTGLGTGWAAGAYLVLA